MKYIYFVSYTMIKDGKNITTNGTITRNKKVRTLDDINSMQGFLARDLKATVVVIGFFKLIKKGIFF